MKMKGSEIAIQTLLHYDITTVTGIPGGSILPLYDALVGSGIRHILARNEQGAAFIAHGMARSTGKPAVCIATSGPGAANLVTALADALHDSVPIVAITGQVSRAYIGTAAFQEIDVVSTCTPVTKKAFQVTHAEDIAQALGDAIELSASGRPGPVLVDIPKDVFLEEADFFGRAPVYKTEALIQPDTDQMQMAIDMISSSQRPVILAGGGIILSESSAPLLTFAEKNSIPIIHTLMGKGCISADHPLSMGLSGMHGSVSTHHIIEEADCMIILGARLSDRVTGRSGTFARKAKIIRIDIGTPLTDKSTQPDIDIYADLKAALPQMIQLIDNNNRSEWLSHIHNIRSNDTSRSTSTDADHSALLNTISPFAKNDPIVTTDVGQHQMWMAQHYPVSSPRSFLTSGGLGTMGFGLPAAIGAALANPEREILCISGDGSILMNIQELATLAELNLNVKIIIFNNKHLGLVRQQQELFFGERYSASSFASGHDFAAIAAGFGIRSYSFDRSGFDRIDEVIHSRGPALIDARIYPDENVLPIVPPGKANTETVYFSSEPESTQDELTRTDIYDEPAV